MLFPTYFTLTLVTFCTELCQAFVRYSVITDVKKTQWQASELCVDRGHDGLAVINTPEKWSFAKILLDNAKLKQEVELWIGLELVGSPGEPRWRGGSAGHSWGKWGPSGPAWTISTPKVLIRREGSDYVWKTVGVNYEHETMCDSQFFSLTMSLHPNPYVDLSTAIPLAWRTTSPDECGLMCASASPCEYVTYDSATNKCSMYDATVSSLLNVNASQPNRFKLYAVAVYK